MDDERRAVAARDIVVDRLQDARFDDVEDLRGEEPRRVRGGWRVVAAFVVPDGMIDEHLRRGRP